MDFLFTFFLIFLANKEGDVLFQLGWFSILKGLEGKGYTFLDDSRYYFNDDIINVNDDNLLKLDGLETL